MFVSFINELIDILKKYGVEVRLFADDIKIYASVGNDIDNIKLQQAVDALAEWAKSWQLCISVSKCCVLNIGKVHHKCNFTIGDNVLSNTSSCRNLGITITHDFGATMEFLLASLSSFVIDGQ
jgi:hypothetical protein